MQQDQCFDQASSDGVTPGALPSQVIQGLSIGAPAAFNARHHGAHFALLAT
jgi:hypothetical protein